MSEGSCGLVLACCESTALLTAISLKYLLDTESISSISTIRVHNQWIQDGTTCDIQQLSDSFQELYSTVVGLNPRQDSNHVIDTTVQIVDSNELMMDLDEASSLAILVLQHELTSTRFLNETLSQLEPLKRICLVSLPSTFLNIKAETTASHVLHVVAESFTLPALFPGVIDACWDNLNHAANLIALLRYRSCCDKLPIDLVDALTLLSFLHPQSLPSSSVDNHSIGLVPIDNAVAFGLYALMLIHSPSTPQSIMRQEWLRDRLLCLPPYPFSPSVPDLLSLGCMSIHYLNYFMIHYIFSQRRSIAGAIADTLPSAMLPREVFDAPNQVALPNVSEQVQLVSRAFVSIASVAFPMTSFAVKAIEKTNPPSRHPPIVLHNSELTSILDQSSIILSSSLSHGIENGRRDTDSLARGRITAQKLLRELASRTLPFSAEGHATTKLLKHVFIGSLDWESIITFCTIVTLHRLTLHYSKDSPKLLLPKPQRCAKVSLDVFYEDKKSIVSHVNMIWNRNLRGYTGPTLPNPPGLNPLTSAAILRDPLVENCIRETANSQHLGVAQVRKRASDILEEIGDQRCIETVYRSAALARFLISKVLSSIELNPEASARVHAITREHPGKLILFLPTHRSYTDNLVVGYIIAALSLQFFPHSCAADDFLKLGPIAQWMRRLGAFFVRRGTRSNQFYTTIFQAYVNHLVSIREPIMFFLEGTRSRKGTSLPPRVGLLQMILEGLSNQYGTTNEMLNLSEAVILPMSLSYERLVDGNLYANELLGIPKPRETLENVMKSLRNVFQQSSTATPKQPKGRLFFHIHEPVFLSDLLPSELTRSNTHKCVSHAALRISRQLLHGTQITWPAMVAALLLKEQVTPPIAASKSISKKRLMDRFGLFHASIVNKLTHASLIEPCPSIKEDFKVQIDRAIHLLSPHVSVDPVNAAFIRVSCSPVAQVYLQIMSNQLVHLFVHDGLNAILARRRSTETPSRFIQDFDSNSDTALRIFLSTLLSKEYIDLQDASESNFSPVTSTQVTDIAASLLDATLESHLLLALCLKAFFTQETSEIGLEHLSNTSISDRILFRSAHLSAFELYDRGFGLSARSAQLPTLRDALETISNLQDFSININSNDRMISCGDCSQLDDLCLELSHLTNFSLQKDKLDKASRLVRRIIKREQQLPAKRSKL